MSSIDGKMVGLISLNASPYEIASQAARDAAYVCIRTHGDAPEVRAICNTMKLYVILPRYLSFTAISR